MRGAQPAPLSHGGEAQGRACPADMAAGNGHSGIAAFLSEQALLRLAKDNNISLDDSADARAQSAFDMQFIRFSPAIFLCTMHIQNASWVHCVGRHCAPVLQEALV